MFRWGLQTMQQLFSLYKLLKDKFFMVKCPNCFSLLNCNCMVRKASDGNDVCQNCRDSYEYKLKTQKAREQKPG
jgi:hypothetical protein